MLNFKGKILINNIINIIQDKFVILYKQLYSIESKINKIKTTNNHATIATLIIIAWCYLTLFSLIRSLYLIFHWKSTKVL